MKYLRYLNIKKKHNTLVIIISMLYFILLKTSKILQLPKKTLQYIAVSTESDGKFVDTYSANLHVKYKVSFVLFQLRLEVFHILHIRVEVYLVAEFSCSIIYIF